MKKYIVADAKKLNKAARVELAKTTMSVPVLYRLALDGSRDVVQEVVANPSSPTRVLRAALNNKSHDYGIYAIIPAAIRNPNCDEAFIRYILDNFKANISDYAVREVLKKTRSSDILKTLLSCPDNYARQEVAKLKDLPKDILDELAFDPSHYVRETIAARSDVSPDILDILIYDSDISVRRVVFANPNLSEDTLEDAVKEFDYSNVGAVSSSNNLNSILSTILARNDVSADVVNYIAENAILHGHPTPRTRNYTNFSNQVYRDLIMNPKLSAENMNRILDLDIDEISLYALNNPNTDPDTRAQLMEYFVQNGKNLPYNLRSEVLRHVENIDILRQYGRSEDYSDRMAAAANINTPEDVLKRLSNDFNRSVRNAAKATLAAIEKRNRSSKKNPKKASTTGWSISPYELETYADIIDELGPTIDKAMGIAAKTLGSKLTYQFDVDDYDTAEEITVTKEDGTSFVLDAQDFLAYLTSDVSKNVGAKNAANYVCRVAGALQS